MKHLAESLRSYNNLKQLIAAGRLEEAYRKIEQLPRKLKNYKLVKVNLYALLAMAQTRQHRAIRSLTELPEGSNTLMGLTLSNLSYLYFREGKIFEAENFSLKAIPLLQTEFGRMSTKRHPSKTVTAQLKLLLAFCYLLMIYACCQNDEYKRAYDYILKTKRICGDVLRAELERQLKAVKEVYKYKLAFGGLHEERLRHLEHHRLIVKSLEQETKYHHEANEKRGDKIQLKLERLNRELIQQANKMTLEDVKKIDKVPEGSSDEDSQRDGDQGAPRDSTPMDILANSRQQSLDSLKLQSVKSISQHVDSNAENIEQGRGRRPISSTIGNLNQSKRTKTAVEIYNQPLAEVTAPTSNASRPVSGKKILKRPPLDINRKSVKVLHILEILDNPIYPESYRPETIFQPPDPSEPKEIKLLKETIQKRKDIFAHNFKKRHVKNTSSTNTPRFNSRRSKKTPIKEASSSGMSIGDSSSDGMVSAEQVFVKGEVFPAEVAVEVTPKRKKHNGKDGKDLSHPLSKTQSKNSKPAEDRGVASDQKLPNFHSFGGEKESEGASVEKYKTGMAANKHESSKKSPTFARQKNPSEVQVEIANESQRPVLKKTGSEMVPNSSGEHPPYRTSSILSYNRTVGQAEPEPIEIESAKLKRPPVEQPLQRASTMTFTLQPQPNQQTFNAKSYHQSLVQEESEEQQKQSKPSKSPRFCAEPDDPTVEQRRMTFGPTKSKTEIPESTAAVEIPKHRVIKSIMKKNTDRATEQLGLPDSQSPMLLSKSHYKISIVEHAVEYHSQGEQDGERSKSDRGIKFVGEDRIVVTSPSREKGNDMADNLERESSNDHNKEELQSEEVLQGEESRKVERAQTPVEPSEEIPAFKKNKPMKTEPANEDQIRGEEQEKFASVMLGQRGSAKETRSEHEFDSGGAKVRQQQQPQKDVSVSRQDNMSQRAGSRNKKHRKGSHNLDAVSVKTASVDLVAVSNELIRNVNSCLEGERAEYSVQYSYHKAGTTNCNQILQLFLNELRSIDEHKRKAASAFVWVLKQCIDELYGRSYCEENDAQEIALLANKFVLDVHPKYQQEVPFSFEVLIDLTEIFFLWLYRRKLTKYMIREVEE